MQRSRKPSARSLALVALLALALAACAERVDRPAPGGPTVRNDAAASRDPSCVASLRFDQSRTARPASRFPGAAWRVDGELPVTAPVVSGSMVYGGTSGILPGQGCVFAAEAHTGRLRWAAEGGISPGTPPLAAGALVVTALDGGDLVARDGREGTARWVIETGGFWQAGPVLQGDTLYAAPDSGVLAVDPRTGRLRWRVRGPVGAMVAERDAVLVSWAGPSEAVTAALDPVTGRQRWRASVGATDAVVVARTGGTVVLRSSAGTLYGLGFSNGRRLWRLDVADGGSTPVAAARGRLLFRAGDGDAYAVDARTGKVAWRTAVGFGDHREAPAVDGSSLYVGGSSALASYFWALDLGTGRVRWRLATESPVETQPCVQGDLVLLGDDDGWVYAVDRRSGRLRARYAAGGGVDRTLAVAGRWVFARVDATGLVGVPL